MEFLIRYVITLRSTYRPYNSILTLSNKGGSFNMNIDNRNTKAGAVENSAVTSVAGIVISALA